MMKFGMQDREIPCIHAAALVKCFALTLWMALAGLAACKEKNLPMAYPAHPRAAAAAARVRPALQHDLTAAGLTFGDPVFLRAFKEELQLELFVHNRQSGKFQLFRTYPIAASSGALGPKLAEGDGQVPEGFYQVPPAAMKPDSRYHLAFNLGYPNAFDRALGRTGSLIMIHGNRVSIGCLAMTDEKIDEIFTLCAAAHANGQAMFRVHVFPFRMTAGRMAKAAGSKWLAFWTNLQQGYDRFEKSHVPPEVSVRDGRYQFQ
jgi:murein L,D-transpeptidase YafK